MAECAEHTIIRAKTKNIFWEYLHGPWQDVTTLYVHRSSLTFKTDRSLGAHFPVSKRFFSPVLTVSPPKVKYLNLYVARAHKQPHPIPAHATEPFVSNRK